METYNVGFINIPREIFSIRKDYVIIDHSYLNKHKDFYKIDEDKNIIISKEFYSYDDTPVVQPESSTVVLENETGYVKAIVGGLDVKSRNAKILNRATSSPRAPGSLIKPLSVYLPSLENGKTLGSVEEDSPMWINEELYPKNYYQGYYGLLTMRFAIEENSNVAAVKFYEKLGKDKSMKSLQKLGIINNNEKKDNFIERIENKEKNDENIDSLALGNMRRGITNVDIASAYRTIATGGDYKKVSAVIKIEDAGGITIIDNKTTERKNIFGKEECYLITDALRTNVTRGSAKGASLGKIEIAGEIGVNKWNSDLWFTGYSPEYTISTWLGADSPKIELNTDEKAVIEIYKKTARNVHKNAKITKFEEPEGIISKYICEKSGKLGTKYCEEVEAGYKEKFIEGTEPKKHCEMHKKALICNKSGRLAGEYCPKEDVEYKIILDRGEKCNPKSYKGIYPDDYEYMPNVYCNIHDEKWYNSK